MFNLMLATPSLAEFSLTLAIVVVGIFIGIFSVVSVIISIVLAIGYIKYNRTQNSAGLTGVECARALLDANGLENIKVSVGGSFMFGNSYSAYFKKVRLRRFTKNKKSITSLAMGAQKSALAIMHKENDASMKKRIRLAPFMIFGPIAFIPLVILGLVLDVFIFNSSGVLTIILAALGAVLFFFAIVLSFLMLRTETRAQERAYELLRENSMATEEEILEMKKLFKLYNIQYINDIILSILEFIRYVLKILLIFAKAKNKAKK